VRRALLALAVLALSAPAPAGAQVVDLGSGTSPAIAMDALGTAYIAWRGVGQDPTTLNFCRLPRGASACDAGGQIAAPGTSLSRPFVLVQGTTVHVFQYRYGLTTPSDRFDAILRFTSIDGGAGFDAGTQVGVLPFTDAVFGPGNTISVVSDGSGRFQNLGVDATGRTDAVAQLNETHPYGAAVTTHNGSLVAVSAAGNGDAQYRTFTSGPTGPNNAAEWSAPQDVGTEAYGRFTSGGDRTFFLYDAADGFQAVREYSAGGFGAPVVIPGPTKESAGGTHDIFRDPAGRLHVVWQLGDAEGSHVGYATSDDGAGWKTGKFDVTSPTDLATAAAGMRIAINADHLGVLAYDNGGGTGSRVRAAPIGPEPAAAIVPTPTPTPTPAPQGPSPQVGKTVTAEATKGTVKVRLPGAKAYTPLTALSSVPVGSTLDTRKGTVKLNSAAGGNTVQTGLFYDGVFVVKQKVASRPTTDLVLSGGSFKRCPKARRATAAANRRRKVRRLWGDGKGRFRTTGKYASATVRGTKWRVTDRCDGTLVEVRSGVVRVRDKRRRKTVTVKARRSYLARASR
jgi:hypothetical protein